MIELLLSAGFTCAEANHIISKMRNSASMPKEQIEELVHVIKDYKPECFNERSVPNQ